MQDRYTADLGDYVKYALLRRLMPDRTLGVLWWLYPDEGHNADGKHIAYLRSSALWRRFDPDLFDQLVRLVESEDRSVSSVEKSGVPPQATFFSEPVPTPSTPSQRRDARARWFADGRDAVASCDLVFLDPDNGLETRGFSLGAAKAGKSVALHELDALRESGRTLVVYHHHTRMAGGNHVELAHWGERLAERGFRVDAIRAAVGTARAFFLLDAAEPVRVAAAEFASDWRGKVTWHPRLG